MKNSVIFLVFAILSVSLALWNYERISDDIRNESALQYADQYVNALETVRTRYTSEVVARAKEAGIEVIHNYQERSGAIPLPVTFSMDIGKHME